MVIIQILKEELSAIIQKAVCDALLEQRNIMHSIEPDQWFDLTRLCEYLPDKPAKATVYGWVSQSNIPYHKKSKKLFFLKSEIDNWLKADRQKTDNEFANEAENYLIKKKN